MFTDPIVTIGRDPANAYVIEQTDVSRWHCVVVNFRGDVWLYDLNSRLLNSRLTVNA